MKDLCHQKRQLFGFVGVSQNLMNEAVRSRWQVLTGRSGSVAEVSSQKSPTYVKTTSWKVGTYYSYLLARKYLSKGIALYSHR